MENQLINLLMYCIPTLVTGAIAYMFFREHLYNETNRRNFLIQKDLQKEALPLRLQAYERMALFLERISPNRLLVRVQPTSNDKHDYETLLIATIEQEFEHNLTQQIYVSSECWGIINTAKNATIQSIRKANKTDGATDANSLREVILTNLMEQQAPSDVALAYLKNEISDMW
ncbi:hypothetical protein IA57_10650 [Mangrovimonas yunxiaonensis]|uniref:Uncharacterized protein n=1 Tax=Mangrovimonas yunxiaonensis TaxID=1197477 RepID=A0A084TJL2_9FLAO|nr:hypothetical protein [Mangrovimonas yunxiaonensis]KFB00898.1 hypothetical protein IA57_10650 [Mangrovimonas yunxiaonensis]MBR9757845.1 hypothetical protein [Algicola sp.]GGH43762.1 hypothetical protein GCM10011364_16150 [Mangrovimonas yunxiaonensis]